MEAGRSTGPRATWRLEGNGEGSRWVESDLVELSVGEVELDSQCRYCLI